MSSHFKLSFAMIKPWATLSVLSLMFVVGFSNRPIDATSDAFSQSTPMFCQNGSTFIESNDSDNLVLGHSQGMNLGWFVKFSSIPGAYTNEAESVPIIRFKPAYDASGNRTYDYFITQAGVIDDPGVSILGIPNNGVPNEYPLGPQLEDGGIGLLVRSNPGKTWIVGNEVDRIHVQDSLMPSTYATAYHDVYNYIKSIDPTAQVATSALVQVTPGRIQYLDLVLDAYRRQYGVDMPVDIWTFHVYVIPEVIYHDRSRDSGAAAALGTDRNIAISDADVGGAIDSTLCSRADVYCRSEHDDIELFKEHVIRMRTWMADRGYKETPLLLTEWSILWPRDIIDEFGNAFPYSRAATYLDETLAFLESASDPNIGYSLDRNRLVQRWSWYPVTTTSSELANSSELVANGALTSVGIAYRDRINQQGGPYIDLIVDDVFSSATPLQPGESTADVTVTFAVRNAGNVATSSTYVANIIDTSDDSIVTSTVIPAGVGGCTTDIVHVDATWSGLAAGNYDFKVEIVDPADPTPANNSGTSSVYIGTRGIFMPLTSR